METTIISAKDFNEIPLMRRQTDLPSALLDQIASLFIEYGVQDKYGIQLLHRHYDMPDGAIAFTKDVYKPVGGISDPALPPNYAVSVMKVTPLRELEPAGLRGHSYLLNKDNKFQAYEYTYGDPAMFPDHAFFN